MQSSRLLQLRSTRFAIEPGEDEETNPGINGRALAKWLAERLRSSGRQVHGCIAEDFGRVVHVAHPKFQLFVAVASGHDGDDSWQAFTFAEGGGITGLFAKREKLKAADDLLQEVELILRTDAQTVSLESESGNGA